MGRIYLVEDDDNIRELVCYALRSAGFEAEGFAEAKGFWTALAGHPPDFVLLDIMLPGEDGLSILQKLRSHPQTRRLPIILLTAKGQEHERIRGLDLGADDYITKPFSVMELLSRVKAVLRRSAGEEESHFTLGAIRLWVDRRAVTAQDQEISLTYTEFELLHHFMQNPGIVLSRERLMERLWGIDADLHSRTVDMHIKSLRQKLGPAGKQIQTVRGVGYKMEAAA
ncbi:MAG: response regulator transcription factor [Candidatus Limiplasma sp.]|nr:response regulator transcription factor [Candidatus Limiplasma sp.]